MGKWSIANTKNLARILRCFHAASGLKVNFNKSKVFGIGVSDEIISQSARILGCEAGSFPFQFLGVPVGANMNRIKNWDVIVEKFNSKMSIWKAKSLSFGGRVTLLQAVLNSLPIYYFSIFKVPAGVLTKLEKIRRKFLWNGGGQGSRIHWASWEQITRSKANGGLGVGSLRSLNIGLMLKWWWRLKTKPNALWCKVIINIHNLVRKPASYIAKKTAKGTWNNIASVWTDLEEFGLCFDKIFKKDVGSGNNTFFWLDKWWGDEPLKASHTSLYQLEKKKSCLVSDRITSHGTVWDWKISPHSLVELRDIEQLSRSLSSFCPSNRNDVWRCELDSSGAFSVGVIREFLDNLDCSRPRVNILWSKIVPIKVSCFIWRALLGRIPSAEALIRRGIHLNSSICSLCNSNVECYNHILLGCGFAKEVWNFILLWCGDPDISGGSVEECLLSLAYWGRCPKKRRLLTVIVYGIM